MSECLLEVCCQLLLHAEQSVFSSSELSLAVPLFSFVVERSPYSPAPSPFPLRSLPPSLPLSTHPPISHSLLFHASRVTPVPLTPPRSTQSTAFISFLLPFRAYFASLERRCAFYALSAPDPSSEPNPRGGCGVGGALAGAVATRIRGKVLGINP